MTIRRVAHKGPHIKVIARMASSLRLPATAHARRNLLNGNSHFFEHPILNSSSEINKRLEFDLQFFVTFKTKTPNGILPIVCTLPSVPVFLKKVPQNDL